VSLADFGASGVLFAAETIGAERAKMPNFWAPGKTTKSARTLRNPNEHAGIGEKNPTGGPVGFDIWWWSADAGSNPISKAVRQVYVTCPRF